MRGTSSTATQIFGTLKDANFAFTAAPPRVQAVLGVTSVLKVRRINLADGLSTNDLQGILGLVGAALERQRAGRLLEVETPEDDGATRSWELVGLEKDRTAGAASDKSASDDWQVLVLAPLGVSR